jgi:pimeloyl-ACP methyl ester carboxylesterase
MANWFSGDVGANGIRLHYHRTVVTSRRWYWRTARPTAVCVGPAWRRRSKPVHGPQLGDPISATLRAGPSDPELGGIVTPEVARKAAGILASLHVVRLSGAGHNIRREQFEPFVAAVREFLAINLPSGQIAPVP